VFMSKKGKSDEDVQLPEGIQSPEDIQPPLIKTADPKAKFFLLKPKFPREKINEFLVQALSSSGETDKKHAPKRLQKWVDKVMVRVDKKNYERDLEL